MRLFVTAAAVFWCANSANAHEPSVDEWLARLRAATPKIAAQIAYDAEAPVSSSDVLQLLAAANDTKTHIRSAIARRLGDIASTSASADVAPTLVRLLADNEHDVRAHAAVALVKRGGDAAAALTLLLRHRPDERFLFPGSSRSLHVADYAVFVLAKMGGEAVPAVVAALQRGEISLEEATAVFQRMDDSATLALIEVAHASPLLRSKLLQALPPFSADAGCTSLRPLLSDSDLRQTILEIGTQCPEVAEYVAATSMCDEDTLAAVFRGAQATQGMKVLESCVTNRRLETFSSYSWSTVSAFLWNADRDEVASAVGEKLLTAVRTELRSQSAVARSRAAELIGLFGGAGAPLVPDILPLLTEPTRSVRSEAYDTLTHLGPSAAAAVEALRQLLQDSRADRYDIARALLAIEPPERLTDILLPLLRDESTTTVAAKAISDRNLDITPFITEIETTAAAGNWRGGVYAVVLRSAGPAAVPSLLRLAKGARDLTVRRESLLLALDIDPDNVEANSRRRTALALETDPDARREILRSYKAPLTNHRDLVAIATVVASPKTDYLTRIDALRTLRSSGATSRAAAALLRNYLEFAHYDRAEVVATIFAMDPSPSTARPILEAVKTSPERNELDRRAAVAALNDITFLHYEHLLPLLHEGDSAAQIAVLQAVRQIVDLHHDAVPYILAAAADADAAVRLLAAQILGRFATNVAAAETLTCLLSDADRNVRHAAAEALADQPSHPVAADLLTERFTLEYVAQAVWEIAWALHPRIPLEASTGGGQISPSPSPIPLFPLPPPRSSAYDVMDRDLIGRDGETLSVVHRRLSTVLRRLGYGTQGLFYVPGGFALMTLIERIDDTGKPHKPPARWTRTRIPPRSVREYLQVLFAEKPGRFRAFVFVVTPREYLGVSPDPFSVQHVDMLLETGGRVLPQDIGILPFRGRYCHVLVYAFDKRPGRSAILVDPSADGLQVTGHLAGAGIAASLTPLR